MTRRDRRRAAYRAWCAGHTRSQAATMCAAATILGSMPDPPWYCVIAIRALRLVAADLTAATTSPPVQAEP